jgi:putative acetyltransferase
VLGHPPFYSRFGFEPSVNDGIESSFSVPPEFLMVKFLQLERKGYLGRVSYPIASITAYDALRHLLLPVCDEV